MEKRAWITIVFFLLKGCSQPLTGRDTIATIPPPQQELLIPSQKFQKRDRPRKLKLTLTLDTPQDLKVKEEDPINQGQVISDRKAARAHLKKERQALQLKLEQLRAKMGAEPASYAVEQAEMSKAQLYVEQARSDLAHFRTNSPWTNYARDVLPLAENVELAELEAQYQQEQVKLEVAIARFQAAKAKLQVLQQDASVQQADLLRKITATEEKLGSIGVVRSPFGGTVNFIRWLGQTDNELNVEIVLIVGLNTELVQ